MPIKKIIHCLVDPEPRTYHGASADHLPVAINLSFEVVAENMTVEEAEEQAKPAWWQFVVGIGAANLLLYVRDSGLPVENAKFKAVLTLTRPQTPAARPLEFFAWLEARNKNGKGVPWATMAEARQTDTDTPINSSRIGITHISRSVQSWNAPVGHNEGLTCISNFLIEADKDYFCIPWFAPIDDGDPDNPDSYPLAADHFQDADQPGQVDCAYDPGGGWGEIVCRTNFVAQPLAGALDGLLTDEGFLVVNPDAVEISSLVSRVIERGASLLNASAHVPGLAGHGDWADLDEQLLESLKQALEPVWTVKVVDEKTANFELKAPMLAWQAVAQLAGALDPVMIGMLRPLSNTKALQKPVAGELVAQLDVCLLDAANQEIPNPTPEMSKLLLADEMVRAVRSLLDQSGLVSGNHATLVDSLTKIFGFSPNAEGGDASDQRLAFLLKSFASGKPTTVELYDEEATRLVAASVNVVRDENGSVDGHNSSAEGFKNDPQIAIDRLMQKLWDEAGVEAIIIRLLENAAGTDGVPAALSKALAAQATALGVTLDSEEGRKLPAVAAMAWRDFLEKLDKSFDGARAAARSAGHDFVAGLLAASKQTPRHSLDELCGLIREADYFAARLLGDVNGGAFDGIATKQPLPAFFANAGDKANLSKWLEARYAEASQELIGASQTTRFRPDSAPRPLPVQMSSNLSGASFDDFAKDYNGISVAMRRIDDVNSSWAHLNLAELSLYSRSAPPGDPAADTINHTLHPVLPVANDGQAAMFLNYEGFPFASSAFAGTTGDEKTTSNVEEAPYYRADVADYDDADGFKKAPALAYGRTFESFAFATTNAGTLPLDLQTSPNDPWLPNNLSRVDQGNPTGNVECLASLDYQRRTAIGAATLTEEPKASGIGRLADGKRIGASIEGVHPLAADYPRLSLTGAATAPDTLDLFRAKDGSGLLAFPAGRTDQSTISETILADIRLSQADPVISLEFFDEPDISPDIPQGQERFRFSWRVDETANLEKDPTITLRLTTVFERSPDDPAKNVYHHRFTVCIGEHEIEPVTTLERPGSLWWVRMELGTEQEAASMSFADPKSFDGHGSASALPLVLLAPLKGDPWKAGLSDVTAKIVAPRVSYLDFERWMANPDLQVKMLGKGESAGTFLRALLQAYIMRHYSAELAFLVDRLPDPAVCALRIGATEADRLEVGTGAQALAPREIALADRLSKLLQLKEFIPPDGEKGWKVDDLRRMLKWLDREFTFDVSLKATGTFDLNVDAPDPVGLDEPRPLSVTVGARSGTVVHLSIAPLVDERHFTGQVAGDLMHPAVLNSGLKQHASQSVGGRYVFPATSIAIETMADLFPSRQNAASKEFDDATESWREFTQTITHCRPSSLNRAYDVVAVSDAHASNSQLTKYRYVGEIDVETQRWRFSGRPIRAFFDPHERRWDNSATKSPALRLQNPDQDASDVTEFEDEAFHDREDFDAELMTHQLESLPAETRLLKMDWGPPGATYFRHRFVLRSRYAGAFSFDDRGQFWGWPVESKNALHRWTMRVAMLADLSRLTMTRPQVRALMPLTGTPAMERIAPPVLAIFQEPPFARAGLADRIGSELKTSFGWGFAEESKKEDGPALTEADVLKPTVEILDSRKEIGPDPRLSYSPMEVELALGLTLDRYGPIGLTFDDPDSPAPAFPNSMSVLSPISMGRTIPPEQSLEEHFLGIAFRRYADPAWLFDPRPPAGEGPFPSSDCWWIDEIESSLRDAGEFVMRLNGELIIEITVTEGTVIARVPKLILGSSHYNTTPDKVEIARCSAEHDIALLHQPLAPGHFATSVFCRATTEEEGGQSGPGPKRRFCLLSSFEWKAVNGDDPKKSGQLDFPKAAGARHTMASVPTSIAWARTGRDYDRVHAVRENPDGRLWQASRNSSSEITVRLGMTDKDRELSFEIGDDGSEGRWITSSVFATNNPLYTHRHLAVIATRFSDTAGRPVEVFEAASLLRGRKARYEIPTPPAQDTGPSCIRIVELETPAAILCGKDAATIPAAFRSAYFDLVSTGGTGAQKLHLFFRFVGSPGHLSKFNGLTIAIHKPWTRKAAEANSGNRVEPAPVLTWSSSDAGGKVGLWLDLAKSDAGGIDAKAVWLTADGKTVDSNDAAQVDSTWNDLVEPGFILSVEQSPRNDVEFWTDISLLHSMANSSGTLGDFDFNWLFSQSETDDPSIAIKPAALAAMVEAQARIVSVTPPIPVTLP
jgi:hypothetical protein